MGENLFFFSLILKANFTSKTRVPGYQVYYIPSMIVLVDNVYETF